MGYEKLFVVFQPHTFSRTKELFDEFAYVLAGSLAEKTVLAPIYPARETNIYGVTSDGLAAAVKNRGADAVSAGSLDEAAEMIKEIAGDGDCVVVAGAGDIDRLPAMLTEKE